MTVKDAVKIAVDTVADVFSDETPTNIGLEEVSLDDVKGRWNVTIGFSRPWDYQTPGIVAGLQPKQPVRQYKIVTIREFDGRVEAIKIREP